MSLIVCIEDEAVLREIIVEELEEAGHEVLQAGDGEVGLAVILNSKPDLVISDITMPRMNGIEMLTELRKNHPEYAEMPFILLSALSDKTEILEGIKQGADDYLTKPVDFDMLLVKVNAWLRQIERIRLNKTEELKNTFLID